MLINFTPQETQETLQVSVDGDVLTLNGEEFDFTPLPEGGVLPSEAITSRWIARHNVTRTNGHITLTLVLPYKFGASDAALFPQPITVTQSGPVELPQ